MFSPEEMDSIPMSELVLMAGADWDTYNNDAEDEYIEACILSNTANQIVDELTDLDSLFVIYHDKAMLNHYNRLVNDLKGIRANLHEYR